MSKKTLIATAVGTAFVSSLAVAPIASAAENPFALSGLSSGYQVADSHGAKGSEGKCGYMKGGRGQCGMSADADKDGKVSKDEADKMHESMFTEMDANKDGFIDKTEMGKMMDGKCGATKGKAMEGKCSGMK